MVDKNSSSKIKEDKKNKAKTGKTSSEEYMAMFKEELHKSPLFSHDTSEVNWAMIGSFGNFEELIKTFGLNTKSTKRLNSVAEEIFGMSNSGKIPMRDKIIWFYKYFLNLMLMNPEKEEYKNSKRELITTIFNICSDGDELTKTYHLIKLLAFMCMGFYAILIAVIYPPIML